MMQLGTRWRGGEEPPRQVPDELRAAVAAHEKEHSSDGGWTLTYLEGRPIVEHDDGDQYVVDRTGNVRYLPYEGLTDGGRTAARLEGWHPRIPS